MTGQPVENLEDALNRTLERHAEKAPTPASDLIGRVETRYRRRRRARMTGAAAAMALVLGGTTFGVWPDDGGTVGPQGSPNPAAAAPGKEKKSPFEITPIEKLWPEAVHRIPTKLPDGTEIAPQALIDERTVLVSASAGFEKTSALYAYDLATGKARKITDVVTPKGTEIFASGFTVGDGQIIWYTSADETSTIWSVPVEGGTAVQTVKRIPGSIGDDLGDDLTISGGKIYWSVSRGGVYTAPLAGGSAEQITGTEKERLVQWPWVGSPVYGTGQNHARTSSRTLRDLETGEKGITSRELRNLETGEKRTVGFSPGNENWSCGITWCLGGNSVRGRNGTGAVQLPGRLMISPNEVAALDRFVMSISDSDQKPLLLLNDLKTRRSGSIELVKKDDGVSYSSMENPDSRMYSTQVADEHVIVDLKATG